MLKKEITFVDFDEVERTETFYFNLTEAEVAEMELSKTGGLLKHIQKIVATQNGPELFKLFKDLILMSYGEKSADGRRFVKSQEIRDSFEQTEAYSKLFMELVSNEDPAKSVAAFVEEILPKKLSRAAR